MKVLVVGSGGREHTLAWKIGRSPMVKQVYIAPGNAGTAEVGENVPIGGSEFNALKAFVKEETIDLTLVGPEQPLVDGIVDAFQTENLHIFGPRQSAARLEGSKAFAKRFMQDHEIPTAIAETFTDYQKAEQYLSTREAPIVVKASGLAAGKGVIVCDTMEDARNALNRIMRDKEFGPAGEMVVIEDCLAGEELSIIAITDGRDYKLLVPSQDHKAAYDNDEGPNTGGMGAYAPAPMADESLIEQVKNKIIEPTLEGMREEGAPYVGFLYAGLMLTEDGPKVLEFNCRMGDPEAQVVVPLMKSDLMEVLHACMEGKLAETPVEMADGFATCVVAASGGYPGNYEKGKIITGLDDIADECQVFHAGTARRNGDLVTDGGRVLGITGTGPTLQRSIDRAYQELDKVQFEKMQFRTDIGKQGLKYSE